MCEDRLRKCAHGTEVIELSIAHVHMPPATTHASSEAGFRRSRSGQLCIEQHPLRRAELECKARARREAAGAQRSAIVGSGASRGLQRASQQRRVRRVGGRLNTEDPATLGCWSSTC